MSLISRVLLTRRLFHSTTTPSALYKHKARSLLSLLQSETDPHKIISLTQSASLAPDSQLQRVALSRAVTSLRLSSRPDLIPSFLDSLLLSLKTHRSVCYVILLFGRARLPDHALRTFRRSSDDLGVPHDVTLLNSLLSSLIVANEYERAAEVAVEFPKVYEIEPNLITYNHLIKSLSESRATEKAYIVIEEMETKGIKPDGDTFAHLVSGFYKEEKMEVENVSNLMAKFGFQPGVDIDNVRIQSLCKLRKSGEAEKLKEGMLGRGMKPNVATFRHLIGGFGREEKYEEAKKMFRDMVEKGLKPDCDCYYMLVHYLCVGRDFESALRFAEESIGKKWVPNYTTMRMLVDGLVSIGKVAEARGLIRQMKEKFTVNQEKWKEVEEGLLKL